MFFAKQHHKKGFTLAETILVVAIIAILLAVAAPNVLAYYRQLKLTGLDDDAKTIFMAAQSRLTAMLSAGEKLKPTEVPNLAGKGSYTEKDTSGGAAGGAAGPKVDFWYINKDYIDLHNYVPGGSIESQLQNNKFVVEFNPDTGAVYAVWYWESDNDKFTYDSTYDENAIDRDTRLDEMVGYYGGKGIDRPALGQLPIPELNIINAEELRLDIKVSKAQLQNETTVSTGFGIFTVDVYVNDASDPNGKMFKIISGATLDESDSAYLTGSVVLGTLNPDKYKDTPQDIDGIYYIGGKKFKDWTDLDSDKYIIRGTDTTNSKYNADGILAGNDITVTVVLNCKADVTLANGSTGRLISQSASARTNSLFAGLEDNGGGTKTALIAYGRHLQNLHDSDVSSHSEGSFSSGVYNNKAITAAKQIRDINFASVNPDTYNVANPDPAKSANDIYYWGSTYPVDGESSAKGQDGFLNFHAINNNNLTEYDGKHYEIRNMYIVAESGYGGLFASVSGGDYNNITVVNPHVHGEPDPTGLTTGGSVGAIIGFAGGEVKIDGCKVYSEYDSTKDLSALADLLKNKLDDEKIETTPTGDCYVSALLRVPHIECAESGSSAGGLVGWSAGNITINNSFSSIPVVGQKNAGGLVGLASDISINNSYSASFVYGDGYVSGLVGFAGNAGDNVVIENCYAAGEIMNGNPSSFVGAGLGSFHADANKDGVVNNYSAVKFVNATGAAKTNGGEEKQGSVYGTYSGDDSGKNYYIADPDVTEGYGNQEGGSTVKCGSEVSAADLITTFGSDPKWTTAVAEMANAGTKLTDGDNTKFTHPYNLLDGMNLQVYPYPMLKTNVEVVNDDGTGTARTDLPMEHYGDWVEGEDTPSATMVYYEFTGTSSASVGGKSAYGFYKDDDGNFKTTPTGRLQSGEGIFVIEDGYALSYPTGTNMDQIPDKVKIDSTEYDVDKTDVFDIGGNTLYRIKGLDKVARDRYYHEVEVVTGAGASAETAIFWFNPDLACEVFPAKTKVDTSGNVIVDEAAPTEPKAKPETVANTEGVALVRSARQLAQLGINTNAGTGDYTKLLRGLKYEQEMDIDYNVCTDLPEIEGGYNHVPVTLDGGTYNGMKIYNLKPGALVDTDDLVEDGLFGRVKNATISNVTLINAKVVLKSGDNAVQKVESSTSTPTTPTTPTEPNAPKILDISELVSNTRLEAKQYLGSGDDFDEAGFKIHWKTNGTKVEKDTPTQSWTYNGSEVYKGEYAFTFGGGSHSSSKACSIEFKTDGPATVKIWWKQVAKSTGEKGHARLYKGSISSGNHIATTSEGDLNEVYLTAFEITDAGTYYIGDTDSNGVRYYRIELYDSKVPTSSSDPRPYDSTGSKYPFPVEGSGASGGSIPSGAKVRAGALAGIVDNSTVTGCGVYVDYDKYVGTGDAFDEYVVQNGIGQNDYVGGLIGNVTESSVSSSYSAVKVLGVTYVGGFAGRLAGSTKDTVIEDCYSGGHTDGGTYYTTDTTTSKKTVPMKNVSATSEKNTGVGGFVGLVSNGGKVCFKGVNYTTSSVAIEKEPAVSEVLEPVDATAANDPRANYMKTGTSIGVFIGRVEYGAQIDIGTGNNKAINYATGTLFAKDSVVKRNATVKFVKNSSNKGYAWDDDDDKWVVKDEASVQYVTADEEYTNAYVTMLNPRTKATAKAEDDKYDKELGDVYPYMRAGHVLGDTSKEIVHHGDWTNRLDFIYYEVYYPASGDPADTVNIDESTTGAEIQDYIDNGTIGIYGMLRGQDEPVNTLRHDGSIVYDSGYMVVNVDKDDLGPVDIQLRSVYTKEGENNTNHYNSEMIMESKPINSTKASWANYVYIVPFSVLNIAPSDHYYMMVYVNGVTYVFNPHFAGEAINVDLIKEENLNKELDLDTVREKKGLVYDESTRKWEDTKNVVIRSAWNFASIARYSRESNNGVVKTEIRKQTFLQQMNIDYTKYRDGRIYDGNDNNRVKVGSVNQDRSGSSYIYGNIPILLDGGTYEGNNKTISNIYLSNDSSANRYVGLFGSVLNGSKIHDLYVENVYLNAAKASTDTLNNATNKYEGVYMGVIAAYVDGNSEITNVHVDTAEFDLHKVPEINEVKSGNKVTYEWNYEPGTVKIKAIGGIVGELVSGKVENSDVDTLSINLHSGKYCYKGDKAEKEDDARNTLKVYKKEDGSKPNDAKEAESVVDSTSIISIGGAIGEIDCSGTGASASVSNVTVIDPTITANRGKDNKVGGFVGSVDGMYSTYSSAATDDTRPAVITSCGVYISDGKKDDFDKMGVIANGEPNGRTDGGDKVGGFAGYLGLGANVTGDYSAIRVQGIKYAGGFAGHIKGSHVENCYSGGYVKTDGTYDTANYNVVADTSDGTAGGFVGKIEVAYQAGSGGPMAMYMTGINYTTSSVSGSTNKTGLFAGDGTDDAAEALAAKMGNLKPTNYAGGISNVTARKESTVKIKSAMPRKDKTGTTFTTTSYNVDKTKVFPFDTNLTEHHGDWVEYDLMTAGYWELEDDLLRIYYIPSDLPDSPQERMESGCGSFDHDGRHTDANYEGITKAGYFAAWANDSGKTYSLTGNTSLTEDTDIESRIRTLLGGSTITVKAYDNATSTIASYETWQIKETGGTTPNIDYYVNPAYGMAIEINSTVAGNMGKENKPYEIRTAQQLDNADGSGMYFKQTHDVAGKGYDGYTPNTLSGGEYDGGSYRILDLKITATGSDNAALFSALENGARMVNTILYGTDGKGVISGENAAGIAASMNGGSIKNTTVAGYTITGKTVGGLAAKTTGAVSIANSEATVRREVSEAGGYIGGLVGQVVSDTANTTKISNSYAGGDVVTASGVKLNSGMTYLGGIVGGKASTVTDKIVYDTVYSYVAMIKGDGDGKLYFDDTKKKDSSDFEHVTFYGIGPDVDTDQTDTIGFWSGGIPDPNTDDRALNTALVNLTKWHTTGNVADEVYMPNAGTYDSGANALTNIVTKRPFPYGGYVKDAITGKPIHYGDWPVAERYAGLFYWEQEKITDKDGNAKTRYNFYAYGAELVKDQLFESELIDTICHDHHEDERATILKSGYGYFLPQKTVSDGIDEFSFAVKNGENVDTKSFAFKNDDTTSQELTEALFDQLFPDGNNKAGYTVQLLDEAGGTANIDLFANVKDFMWEITAHPETGDDKSFGMRVYPTFGEAIYGDDFDMGDGDEDKDVAAHEPMKIRTRLQFERLKDNVDNKSLDYIVLTHDIDFAETTAVGYRAGVDASSFVDKDKTNYVPGQIRTRIFDGRSYRLFDVKISVTSTLASTTKSTTYDLYVYDKNNDKYENKEQNVSIVDVYNNPNGDAALFLNNRDSGVTEFRNVVIYSPDGKAVIETSVSGGDAAGIIARSTTDYMGVKGASKDKNIDKEHVEYVPNQYAFNNCVVAGYTIRGGGSVGGLVGEATNENKNADKNDKGAPMKNCEVVAELVGTNDTTHIGGLAGKWRGTVEDCYTGGTIKLEGATATSSTVIGGLVGEFNNDKNVKNCYTYVNFTDTSLTGASIYAFGSDASVDSNSYYYDEYAKDVTFKQGTEASYGTLASKTAGKSAENSYWPKDNTGGYYGYVPDAMGQFPFGAVAYIGEEKNPDMYIHYGQWPESAKAAGVAYYEKYEDGSYGFQIMGLDSYGNELSIPSTICNGEELMNSSSGKITEHRIVGSGYVLFTTDPAKMPVESGGAKNELDKLTVGADDELLRRKLILELNGIFTTDGIKIYPTGESGDTNDHTATVTVGSKTLTIHYTNGFAGVSESQMGIEVKDTATGETSCDDPIQIRTVRQLDNIPSNGTSGKYFKQTHDLYGETYTANSLSNGNPIYTGAAKFAGTYDGGSYRILELSMVGNTTDTEKDVGLFRSASGTIKNVILYSPEEGTATITNNNGHSAGNSTQYNGTGGIVGRSGGSSSTTLKVTNCIVAGYKITGCDAVGGIVGHAYYGTEVTDCVAVNELCGKINTSSTLVVYARGIGGIIGASDLSTQNAGVKVSNCYAGGKITDAGSDTIVGGIFGRDVTSDNEKMVVEKSYSYVDLKNTGAKAENVSAIGGNLTDSGDYASTGNYYLSEKIPSGCNTACGDGLEFAEIEEKAKDAKAVRTYVPGTDGLTPNSTAYQFPAVVKDVSDPNNPFLVHYGALPVHEPIKEAVNGIFYWEKHNGGYKVQYIGQNEKGEAKDYNGLCVDRDGTGIEESGFGYFSYGGATATGMTNAGDEIADVTGITSALTDNGVYEKVTVTAYKTGTATGNQAWNVTSGSNTVTAYVNNAYATVYKSNTPTEVYIRTYDQLRQMDGSQNYKQTHDVDASASESVTYTPMDLASGKTYNGGGYRILELTIDGSGNNYVGLFGEAKGSVQNVVLYSPSGNATISNGKDVGGIAGKINGNTIRNCVVAGYTISGTEYVGGIAGDMNTGAVISGCEAVNKLNGNGKATSIGGIGGRGGGKIENCYAGGEITGGEVSGGKLQTYIGGVYGRNNSSPTVSSCYSYVDLSNVGTVTNYNGRLCTIGYNYSGSDCYYLASKFPTNGTTQGSTLGASTKLTGFSTVNSSYAPKTPSMTGGEEGDGTLTAMTGYPYPAIFTPDNGSTHEHYGTWLTAASGAPGMPEGPSFEGMMSAAVPEELMPEVLALPVNELAGEPVEGETGEILPPDTPDAIKPEEFTLPEPESTDDNGDDGHTEIIDIRVSVARVRRVR